MERKTRRKFNADFKAKVAIEALKERSSIEELARKYELHPTQITVWKKEFIEHAEKLPIIKPRPFMDFMKQIELQVYYKLNKWRYEEEYRVQKVGFNHPQDERRKVTLPPDAYSEIIFGAQINPIAKSEIMAIVKETMPHIKLRQAQLNGNGEIIICDE